MRKKPVTTAPGASLCQQLEMVPEEDFFAFLGITHGTGKNRQSMGTMPPHYKVGREKFYKLPEVEAWIKRRRVDKAAV